MMDDQDVRNRLVEKMLLRGMIGGHKRRVDTVVNMALPTHDRGRGKELLDTMVTDPTAPVEAYGGGARDNVRLTSAEDAVAYLQRTKGMFHSGTIDGSS